MSAPAKVPRIADQGFEVWPVAHVEPSVRNYNSGMIEIDGDLFLATRRFDVPSHRCRIDINQVEDAGDGAVRRLLTLDLPLATGMENLEDGRLFRHRGKIHLAYTEGNYFPPNTSASVQRVAVLRDDWSVEKTVTIEFGKNSIGHEKNWQFFSQGDRLFFVYSISPHLVVEVDRDWKVVDWFHTSIYLDWQHGTLSGGTPPIRIEDSYVSFFHSYERHPTRKRIYSFSAYCFSARAPFEVLGITDPLMYGSEEELTLPNPRVPFWEPVVIFPCGAIRDTAGDFFVSAGVNDSTDVIIRIPSHELHFRTP